MYNETVSGKHHHHEILQSISEQKAIVLKQIDQPHIYGNQIYELSKNNDSIFAHEPTLKILAVLASQNLTPFETFSRTINSRMSYTFNH